ncbi:MAG TPA: hypothetical protein VGQ42_11045 [Candidatus Dormibacteraeota bacterium]|jgi:hypothetical protein|nr:hypothetical protein [Candidatus Dormibacteraeota bacterium]
MAGAGWVRSGGIAGIASCIAAISTFSLLGTAPDSDAGAAQVAAYVSAQRSGLIASGVLVMLAAGLILWFGGTLAGMLRARDPRSPVGLIVLASVAAMVVFLGWDGITQTALAFLSRQGSAQANAAVITALFDLQNGIVMPGAYGFVAAVFLIAVGVAALGGLFAARWLGWLSLVFAALSLAGATMGLTLVNGGTVSPVSYSPAIATAVVTLIASIFMLRRVSDGPASPA